MTADTPEGAAARAAMGAASGTDQAGFEAQLAATKLFPTPAEAVTFTDSPDLKTTMDKVRAFLFDKGLLGSGAPSADVIGIELPNGEILGDANNVKLRFTERVHAGSCGGDAVASQSWLLDPSPALRAPSPTRGRRPPPGPSVRPSPLMGRRWAKRGWRVRQPPHGSTPMRLINLKPTRMNQLLLALAPFVLIILAYALGSAARLAENPARQAAAGAHLAHRCDQPAWPSSPTRVPASTCSGPTRWRASAACSRRSASPR